jgi:hypothetical protein
MKATMTPQQKQALSGLAVTLAASLLAWAQDSLHLLPGPWPTIVGVALTGVVHVWPALGTKDKVQEKAQAIATEAVSRET